MRRLIRATAVLAAALALALGWMQLKERQRAAQEAAERQEAEAYFKELLANEELHTPPKVTELPDPKPADLDWTLERFGEGPISLTDFRGKTIFIDVWATWCKPCVAQMPSVQRLFEQLQGDEYEFLLISPEDPEVVEKYLGENDYTFPIYLTGQEVPTTFPIQPLPATYVVNPRGEIVYQEHGGPKKYDHSSFVDFLKSWRLQPEHVS